MNFSGPVFLFYFLPAVLLVHEALRFSRAAQNVWLLLASLVFYAWAGPTLLVFLLYEWLVAYVFGLLCGAQKRSVKARGWLGAAGSVLALLPFAAGRVARMLAVGGTITLENFVWPLGLAFITLHAAGYLLDVRAGRAAAEKNPLRLLLFLAFFPQAAAGPLMAYADWLPQLSQRRQTARSWAVGACRFVTGLAKKLLIANQMAALADTVFAYSRMGPAYYDLPAALTWLGCLAFTFQLYFDFSSYCDMAVGLGLMLCFRLPENFDYPLAAASVTEFCRLWNISLGGFLKQHIYFPLGGSQHANRDLVVRNLLLATLATSAWYGLGWPFLFWGLWVFLLLAAERLLGYGGSSRRTLLHIYTFFCVSVGLVLLHGEDLYQSGQFYANMLCLNGNALVGQDVWFFLREYWVPLLLAAVFCTPFARRCNTLLVREDAGKMGRAMTWLYPAALLALAGLCCAAVAANAEVPIFFGFGL